MSPPFWIVLTWLHVQFLPGNLWVYTFCSCLCCYHGLFSACRFFSCTLPVHSHCRPQIDCHVCLSTCILFSIIVSVVSHILLSNASIAARARTQLCSYVIFSSFLMAANQWELDWLTTGYVGTSDGCGVSSVGAAGFLSASSFVTYGLIAVLALPVTDTKSERSE